MLGQLFKYHQQPKGADGLFKDANGRVYLASEWQDAQRIARTDPKSLNDHHLALIESFDGTAAADKAADARRLALAPPTVPTPASAAPMSLVDANRWLLKIWSREPDPDETFDREKCAADARADRDSRAPAVPGEYDPTKYLVARNQYRFDPKGLTDEDLRQFDLVDPDLADEARAKRSGYIKATDTAVDEKLERLPVSAAVLLEFVFDVRDNLKSWISTIQRYLREAHARIDALEARVADPHDKAAKLADASGELAALKAKVQVLEQRQHLTYRGIWKADQVYTAGSLVTHSSGLWIAHQSVSKAIPGGMLEESRAWQLIAKGRA